jgi:Astacin (Peptidase family M12A)
MSKTCVQFLVLAPNTLPPTARPDLANDEEDDNNIPPNLRTSMKRATTPQDNKILVIRNDLGCVAEIGYQGRQTTLYADRTCRGTDLLRLLMKVLGFTNESQRRDLDRYVMLRNSMDSFASALPASDQVLAMPFDPLSVMMMPGDYQKYVPKDTALPWPMGDATMLSPTDVASVNLFYECNLKGERECVDHQDCGDHGFCRWGLCQFLKTEGDSCENHVECQSRFCDKYSQQCIDCKTNRDCNELKCIKNDFALARGRCEFTAYQSRDVIIEKCETHDDCGELAFCQFGLCHYAVPEGGKCHYHIQCATRLCDLDTSICIGCKSSKNCPGEHNMCLGDSDPFVHGRCESHETLYGQIVVACKNDTQCGLNGWCTNADVCKPTLDTGETCFANRECHTRYCRSQQCSPCAADDECSEEEECANERCVPVDQFTAMRLKQAKRQKKAMSNVVTSKSAQKRNRARKTGPAGRQRNPNEMTQVNVAPSATAAKSKKRKANRKKRR